MGIPFDGNSLWEYEMVFAADFGSIAGGQLRTHSPGGGIATTYFRDPRSVQASADGSSLGYVLKLQDSRTAHAPSMFEVGSDSKPLPMFGLGCATGVRRSHIECALQLGYRLLDTAEAFDWGYHEDEVGDAVQRSGIPRTALCIQTKIHPDNLGYQQTMRAFRNCLSRLKTEYVDCLLIHTPQRGWKESWTAFIELFRSGKARAIGVSNVDEQCLRYLLRQPVKPHVVQNWMDPYHQDRVVRDICCREGIQYQSYSTLGMWWLRNGNYISNPVLADATLKAIAAKHARDVGQVILNWANSHDVAVIPASRLPDRQKSNMESFDFRLTLQEIADIDALDGKLGHVVW